MQFLFLFLSSQGSSFATDSLSLVFYSFSMDVYFISQVINVEKIFKVCIKYNLYIFLTAYIFEELNKIILDTESKRKKRKK